MQHYTRDKILIKCLKDKITKTSTLEQFKDNSLKMLNNAKTAIVKIKLMVLVKQIKLKLQS